MARYDQEIAAGNIAAALVTALKGLEVEPILGVVPRFLLTPFLSLGMWAQTEATGDDVSLPALVPTMHFDIQIVKDMSDTLQDYSLLQTPVLLLGGAKSPDYLKMALDALGNVLPHAKRITFPGLGHDGPENDGQPDLVAGELRQFFGETPHIRDDNREYSSPSTTTTSTSTITTPEFGSSVTVGLKDIHFDNQYQEAKLLRQHNYYCNLEDQTDIIISAPEKVLLTQYKLGQIKRTKDLYRQLPEGGLKEHIKEKYIAKPELNETSSAQMIDRTVIRAKKLASV